MIRDLKNNISVKQLLEAKSLSAGAAASPWVDMANVNGLVFSLNYGVFVPNTAVAGVSAKLQESNTTAAADATDVDAADMIGAFAGVKVDASDDQRTEWVGYNGSKRYVRVVVTVPAGATSLLCSADAIAGLRDMPIAAVTTAAAT